MYLNQHIVVDQTGLEGAWDLSFQYTFRTLPGQGETITLFDALEKQLGLKLELTRVLLPVMVVDNVNEKPTDNPPNTKDIRRVPAPPTKFEVAVVKPSTPAERGGFRIQAGGRISVGGMTLRAPIRQAWNLPDELIFGAPKWIDDARFDITAQGDYRQPEAMRCLSILTLSG